LTEQQEKELEEAIKEILEKSRHIESLNEESEEEIEGERLGIAGNVEEELETEDYEEEMPSSRKRKSRVEEESQDREEGESDEE
ncbi:MAG: hypothetical protein QXW00_04535, partial [Candidatus Woesearchaeota archaeon]